MSPVLRFLLPASGCVGALCAAAAAAAAILPAVADAPLTGVAVDACLPAGLLTGVAAGLTGVFLVALGDGDGGADAMTSAMLRSRFTAGRPAG